MDRTGPPASVCSSCMGGDHEREGDEDYGLEEAYLDLPEEFTDDDYQRVVAQGFDLDPAATIQRRVIWIVVIAVVLAIMVGAVLN